MKMIHVITLFMAIIGGMHFVLTGIGGTDLITTIFGTTHTTLIHLIIGASIMWHVTPMIKTHLATL
jgi:uncharacterized membrane protein YuzA (DUF378 family)